MMVEAYYLFREILIIHIKCSLVAYWNQLKKKSQSELGTKIEVLTDDAMKYVKKPEEIVNWDPSFFEEP